VQVYEKQHLHAGEEVAFAPGSGGAPLRLGDWLVGLAICADVTHPEHAASAAARGCHVYAAGCALTPSGYEEDAALLRRYAAEHRMAVLMANYAPGDAPFPSAGRSAIWSSDGTPLNEAPAEGEWLATGSWDGAAWSDASCTKA
jgi:predicted amidohydrolase